MPTDIEKLRKKVDQLSLALCRQSTKRQILETASIKETAKILTEISKILYQGPDVKIQNLGEKFGMCCSFRPGGVKNQK